MDFKNFKESFKRLALLSVFILSFIGFASASMPALIGFQGTLTDKNGVALNGSVSITFNIYTSSSGGTSIYNETDSVTASNGLVSVLIGANNPLTSLSFNQPYYLGVNVNNDGEMAPRLALSDAPYAFNSITAVNSTYSNSSVNASYSSTANNSAFLGGVAASSYVQSGSSPSFSGLTITGSASIGGHTPWTNATCSWTSLSTSPTIPANGGYGTATASCNSGFTAISGECTAGLSVNMTIAGFYPNSGGWSCFFYNPASTSGVGAAEALCCPS